MGPRRKEEVSRLLNEARDRWAFHIAEDHTVVSSTTGKRETVIPVSCHECLGCRQGILGLEEYLAGLENNK